MALITLVPIIQQFYRPNNAIPGGGRGQRRGSGSARKVNISIASCFAARGVNGMSLA